RNPAGVAWAVLAPITENRMQFVALRREAHEVINGRPPDDPWWLLYKARLLARLGRDAAAEELFAQAAAPRPDDAAGWLTRGVAVGGAGGERPGQPAPPDDRRSCLRLRARLRLLPGRAHGHAAGRRHRPGPRVAQRPPGPRDDCRPHLRVGGGAGAGRPAQR